jgi:hypothetical protein
MGDGATCIVVHNLAKIFTYLRRVQVRFSNYMFCCINEYNSKLFYVPIDEKIIFVFFLFKSTQLKPELVYIRNKCPPPTPHPLLPKLTALHNKILLPMY